MRPGPIPTPGPLMEYNWNWSVLWADPYLGWLISGVQWTFAVALAAWVIAFGLGIMQGLASYLCLKVSWGKPF